MAEYVIKEEGKRAKDNVKSPDGKAILEYMTEHIKVNPDEIKLMLGISNTQGELDNLTRAGFIRRVEG